MKLFRTAMVTGVVLAALTLAGCHTAVENKPGDTTGPVVLENFEGYADSTALAAGWAWGYSNNAMSSKSVALNTASALVGAKSLDLNYGATAQYGITDLYANTGTTSPIMANLSAGYKAGHTGLALTVKTAAFDNLNFFLRGTDNANCFQAIVVSGQGGVDPFTPGTKQVIKVPFSAFAKPGWAPSHTVASIEEALAAGDVFTDFTIEAEVDDVTTVGLNTLRTLTIDNISLY